MEPWVLVTLAAASAQMLRFMLQKILRTGTLSTAGSTFARFAYSAPIVVVISFFYGMATDQSLPTLDTSFWIFAVVGGISQILATMCVVALFTQRNFAVGITFKKTEVLLAAIVGLFVLGEGVTASSLVAILIGLAGVLLLSDPPEAIGVWHQRIVNKAAGLGLLSGMLFAISGVAYRGASTGLGTGDIFFRAIITLAFVTTFQTIVMVVWLAWRERGEIGRVLAAWRVAGLVGVTSMIGSACWFVAFTMQTVALVKAVGQAELLLSLVAGWLVFGEVISRREWQGLVLIGCSILLLIWVT